MKQIAFLFALLISFSAQAQVRVSPWFLDFGTVPVNSMGRSSYVTVYNMGNRAATYMVDALNCWNDFEIDRFACHAAVFPGGRCIIQVNYRPRFAGMHDCTMSIRDFAHGSSDSVRLSGTAVNQ